MIPLIGIGQAYCSFAEFVQIWYDTKHWAMPQLHYDIATWLEDTVESNSYRLLMAFRYAAKSELTSLYVAWRLYLNPDFTTVIVSAGSKLAMRNSTYIRNLIERHVLTQHLVPDDDEWKATAFNVRRPTPGLHHSVVCTSLTAAMTGFHGDELIGDDIEVDENCRTVEGRETILSGVQEMTSMCDHLLYVGTPHCEETIYKYLQYEQGYCTLKKPVWDKPNVPAWPEERGTEWIKQKETQLTSGKFRSQFLLIPERTIDSLIDTSMVKIFNDKMLASQTEVMAWNATKNPSPIFYIGDERIIDIRAYWDTATGLKGNDLSVVSAVARSTTGNYYVLGLDVLPGVDRGKGENFDKQCDAVLDFCQNNTVNSILVEKNFLPTLPNQLKLRAAERRHRIAIRDSSRTRTEHKQEFIATLIEPLIKTGHFYVHFDVWKNTPLKQELQDFPNSKQDSCIDTVAGCLHALSPHRTSQGNLPPLHQQTVRREPTPISVNYR